MGEVMLRHEKLYLQAALMALATRGTRTVIKKKHLERQVRKFLHEAVGEEVGSVISLIATHSMDVFAEPSIRASNTVTLRAKGEYASYLWQVKRGHDVERSRIATRLMNVAEACEESFASEEERHAY